MEKTEKVNMLSKTTALLSFFLAILGVMGIVITPKNAGFIILVVALMVSFSAFFGLYQQTEQNKRDINEMASTIHIEKRFNGIEKEISEQRGRISCLAKK